MWQMDYVFRFTEGLKTLESVHFQSTACLDNLFLFPMTWKWEYLLKVLGVLVKDAILSQILCKFRLYFLLIQVNVVLSGHKKPITV